jgi:WD40 repeat protein
VWDAETGGEVVGPLKGHSNYVASVAFSPDGCRIVSGSFDNTIRVWNAETGAGVMGPLKGHSGPVLSVAFSPDGHRIVSGSEDMTIRVQCAITGGPEVCIFGAFSNMRPSNHVYSYQGVW